jgi:hypothetical protein
MHLKLPEIESTPKGAKVELEHLYVYPDGKAFLFFGDGSSWHLSSELALIENFAGLVGQAQRVARGLEPKGNGSVTKAAVPSAERS